MSEPIDLVREAQRILDAAASRQRIETAELTAFARACLDSEETSRRALAVLDSAGGLFMPRRALELAAHILQEGKRK